MHTDFISGLLPVIIIFVVRMFMRTNEDRRLPRDHGLSLEPATDAARSTPSVFMRLTRAAELNPHGPIDHALVDLSRDETGDYIAGLADISADWSDDGSGWPAIVNVVLAIKARTIRRWEVVERNVAAVDLYANRRPLLRALRLDDITPEVAGLFWELARSSDDVTAIKWGMTIGSIAMSPMELDDMMVLARHSEFTSLACEAIVRESERRPEYRERLLDLLETTSGLGRVVAIGSAIGDTVLMRERANRWLVVRAAAELRRALMPTFAAQLVEQLDLAALAATDAADIRRQAELASIAEAALGVDDRAALLATDNFRALVGGLVEQALRLPPSIDVLSLLRALRIAVGEDEHALGLDKRFRARIEQAYRHSVDPSMIARAIDDERHRDVAHVVVIEESLASLVPVVREEFEREPTALGVVALGTLGGQAELAMLYEWITGGLDRRSRTLLLRGRSVIDRDGEHADSAYAVVLQFLGRLRTAEALELIREAASDFDPVVRRAAMIAIGELETWQLDIDLKRRIGDAAGDAFEFVRSAASAAVARHGLESYRAAIESPGMN
jgi:hypothetical protein